MANLETRLKEAQSIAKNPKAQLKRYLAEGKKVMGCFPMYTPEVIAHAAGMVPMGMWGAQTEQKLAKLYLPAFACPLMQSCMELGLRGTYEGVSAVMIPTMCDTFRCVSQDWKSGVKIPMISFSFPQNRRLEASVDFLVSEYEHVKGKIEEIAGVKITDEALENSVKIYNEHCALMRKFAEITPDHLDIITPVVRHAVMKSAMFVDKAEHIEIMKDIIEGLEALPAHKWTGKRVVLTGITAEPDTFLKIFEDNGLAVVGDDLGQEMRQYRTDIPDKGKTVMERIARQWNERYACPLAHSETFTRGDHLLKLCKDGGATGVVVCLMKFCDPEEYDFPLYNKQLREAGIPTLSIDIDQQPTNYDQARTRVQAFAEIL